MPVAPASPTKPTLPAAPVLSPAAQNAPPNSTAASPAGALPTAGKAVNPEVSDAVRKLEGLGQAFQGTKAPAGSGDKAGTAAATAGQLTNSSQNTLPASLYSPDGSLRQTAVPAKPPATDTKPVFLSYFPFLGILVAVIMIFIGLRLLKKQTKEQRTLFNKTKKTSSKTAREEIDVVTAPQAASSKVKSNFEVRI
ncbi:hypothetical protein [Sporomusa aerivorans]|uniref:hypothetical protein n=1 Tax=Sporomusa aerivorans TaxID=204936 RepID=UPI00352ABD38